MPIQIRLADPADADAIWRVLEPTIRSGETWDLPRDMPEHEAIAYWCAPGHEVFVALEDGQVLGTYFLQANRPGGGSHVANAGYMTGPWAGGRGLGRAMCEHSIARALDRGFRAIQFNFVVSTNERAVRLWQRCGFAIVGRLPGAFHHPRQGFVDAYVLFRDVKL
jgi:L-amino acid N-acyltransferase YncA